VPDSVTELGRVEFVVARMFCLGSCIRVRVVKAPVHLRPAVSTTLGANDLAVEDGRCSSPADTGRGPAPCTELLVESEFRLDQVDAGYGCFLSAFERGAAEDQATATQSSGG
jgi:hypothetical protein